MASESADKENNIASMETDKDSDSENIQVFDNEGDFDTDTRSNGSKHKHDVKEYDESEPSAEIRDDREGTKSTVAVDEAGNGKSLMGQDKSKPEKGMGKADNRLSKNIPRKKSTDQQIFGSSATEMRNTSDYNQTDTKIHNIESSNEDKVDFLQSDRDNKEEFSQVSDKSSELSEKCNEKSVQEQKKNLQILSDNDKEVIYQKAESEEGILHRMTGDGDNTLNEIAKCREFPMSPNKDTNSEQGEYSSKKQLEETRINECQGKDNQIYTNKYSPENVVPLQVSKNMESSTLEKLSSVKSEDNKQQNIISTDVEVDDKSMCTSEPGNDDDNEKEESTSDLRKQELDHLPSLLNEIQRIVRAEMDGDEDSTKMERGYDAKLTLGQELETIKNCLSIAFIDKNEQIKEIEKERDEYKRCTENLKSFVEGKMRKHGLVKRSKPKSQEERTQNIIQEIENLLETERNELIQKQNDSEEKSKGEINGCKTEISKMREEIKTLKLSVEEKQTKVNDEQRMSYNLEKELNSERKKNQEHLSVNRELVHKQMELQMHNQSIKDDLKNKQTAINEANDKLRGKELQIREQEFSMKAFISQNKSLCQEKENMGSQIFSLQKIKVDLEKTVQILKEEKSKLNLRLSKLAGAHLTRDNPNIADLSDLYRPTKLAEKYSELYDNEWTDAFEELGARWGLSDKASVDEMILLLMTVCKECVRLLKPHRDVFRNIHTVTISLNNLSTRNKLTQTQRKRKPPSDDLLISTNFEDDVHNGEKQVNTDTLSLSNNVSGIDSAETHEERGTTNQVVKLEDIAVVDYDEKNGKSHSEAFKTGDLRNQRLKNEHFDDIANKKYQSDLWDTNEEEETDKEYYNKRKNVKAILQGTETNVIPDDNLESTADNERISVKSKCSKNLQKEGGLADKAGHEKGDIEPEIRFDENNETRSSEENVKSEIKGVIDQDDYESETVQTKECGGDCQDLDYRTKMDTKLVKHSSEDGGRVSIKIIEEPGCFKERNTNSLKESKTTIMGENENFVFVETEGIGRSIGYNAKKTCNHQTENDEISDLFDSANTKETGIRFALKNGGNDSSSPLAEEIEQMNDRLQNDGVHNTACDQKKDQHYRAEFIERNINKATSNRSEGQGRFRDINSMKIAGIEENEIATPEHNTSSRDEIIEDLQREGNNLEQSTESLDERKIVDSKISLNTANDHCNERTKQNVESETKPKLNSYTKREEIFEDADAVTEQAVIEEHQEVQEDDSMRNFRIPDRFDSNVDTGYVCAEISVKTEFTAEQTKIISEMKKICAMKMEQEKKISEVIAQKVAFEVNNEYLSSETVMLYIKKCAELCWYMSIQEPPVVIGFEDMTDEVPFDKDKYKAYTRTGKNLDFVVWPPLYLHEGGPMLCKGTAQARS